MKRLCTSGFAVAYLLLATTAHAQSTADDIAAQADVARALANQPTFPTLRGGTLGVPRFSGEAAVSAQGAVRIDAKTPAFDLFAALGNVALTERTTLSLFAESTRLDAPRVVFDPAAAAPPNPVPLLETQGFQSIGFRVQSRVVADLTDGEAQACYRRLAESRIPDARRPGEDDEAYATRIQVHVPLVHRVLRYPGESDAALRARVQQIPDARCGVAPRDTSGVALREYFYRMRQRSRVGGVHLFAGARYLYRGAAGAGVTASGAAIEGGLVYNPGVAWTLHASLAGTWLARAEELDGTNTVVLPQVFEVRATLGTGWRATFDPDKSLTLGAQTSISWNFWQNDFARAAQTRDVRGWALEASLFASGHLGTNFNGLLSFGVLLPYGTLDDGPRFVFTFAPSAAAATRTRVSDTPCPRCTPCAQCPQVAPPASVVQPVPAVPAVVPVAVATPTAPRGAR